MRRRHLLKALCLLPFAAQAAFAGQPKNKNGGESYLQLPTLTAQIMRGDGRRGVLTVEAGLDAPDPALRVRVELLEPRLRDAYASTLMRFGAGLRPNAPPDVDRMAALLQADTDRVVGQRGARLLLGTVLVN